MLKELLEFEGQEMYGLTVKKAYFYALSFILLAIMLYNVGKLVCRLLKLLFSPPIINIESRKAHTYFNWGMIAKKLVYLVVIAPVYWHHWKAALSLE